MSRLAVSIVLPVFNEEESLPVLAAELTDVLDRLDLVYEVVFVDDGSTDGSLEVMRELARARREVRILHLPRNSGQSAALAAGFRAARSPVIVTLDADGQNDPADIPLLLAELKDCDVVSGIRADRRDTWLRRIASRIANRTRNLIVHDSITDVGCSLKAYRSELLVDLPLFNGLHRFLPALLGLRGARFKQVNVRHRPRKRGTSKYTISNRLWRGIYDLVGVRWLQSRWIDIQPAQEIVVWKANLSGSSSDSQAKLFSSHASSSNGSPQSAKREA